MVDLKQVLAAKLATVEQGTEEARVSELAEQMADTLVSKIKAEHAASEADALPNLIRQVEALATEAQSGSLADPVLARFQSQLVAACPQWLNVLRGMQ